MIAVAAGAAAPAASKVKPVEVPRHDATVAKVAAAAANPMTSAEMLPAAAVNPILFALLLSKFSSLLLLHLAINQYYSRRSTARVAKAKRFLMRKTQSEVKLAEYNAKPKKSTEKQAGWQIQATPH